MKRSIIAVAALLLLLSSTTYATPPRPRPRPRFFLGSVLCWLGIIHHHAPVRMARPCPPAHRPRALAPEHRGRPKPGWHFGWDSGRRNGRRHDNEHRGKPGPDRPREGERGRGRGRG